MLVLLLVAGAGMLTVSVMLVRALVLFPHAALQRGWKPALYAYKFSVGLTAILAVYEAGNLTGFSWTRMRYVSDTEFIQNAITKAYPGIYRDLTDLRVDYPGFAPEVRYWCAWRSEFADSFLERLLGFANYQVKLPDAVVRVDIDGKARLSLDCNNGNCAVATPAHPVFGVIATVQLDDAPYYPVVPDFRAYWSDGPSDDVAKDRHCVSAYSQANPQAAFVIDSPGAKPLKIEPRFGFYLVAARLVPQGDKNWVKGAYEMRRITRGQFLAWRSCAARTKAEWPDFVGSWWKR